MLDFIKNIPSVHTGVKRLETCVIIDNLSFLSDERESDKPMIKLAEKAVLEIMAMPEFSNRDFVNLWAIKNELKKNYRSRLENLGYEIPTEDEDYAWYNLARQVKANTWGYRAIVILKDNSKQKWIIDLLDDPSRIVVLSKDHYEILTNDEYLEYASIKGVNTFENGLASYVERTNNMYKRYLAFTQAYPCPGSKLQLERPENDSQSIKQYEHFATEDGRLEYDDRHDRYYVKSPKFSSSRYNYVSTRHPGYISGGMRDSSHKWVAYKKWEVTEVFAYVVAAEQFYAEHGEDPALYDIDVEKCPHCGKPVKVSRFTNTTTCFFCGEEFRNKYCISDIDPDWGDSDDSYDDESDSNKDSSPIYCTAEEPRYSRVATISPFFKSAKMSTSDPWELNALRYPQVKFTF